MATLTLTGPQISLLAKLDDKPDGMYIYGSEIKTARSLVRHGLVALIDDGLSPLGGNRDGERWSIEITEAGRQFLKRPREVSP